MNDLRILSLIILGLLLLACILASLAAHIDRIFYPHGHDVSPALVRKQLELILDGSDPYALDDFISCGSFKDPRLEAMRQRVAQLDEEFPPESKSEYCSPKGMEVIREYIQELKHDAPA